MVQPQAVIERIGELTFGDDIVVTDWSPPNVDSAQYYPYQKKRQIVTSWFLGNGLWCSSSNRGAKIANPDKEVVLCWVDGFFQMTPGVGYFEYLQGANQGGYAEQFHSLGISRQWQILL